MGLSRRLWHRLREHRTLLAILVLAGLAAYTGWRRVAVPPARDGGLPPEVAVGADYSLERFVLTLLDESGRTGLSLTGLSLEHDPRRRRSRIESPEATITAREGVRWEGSAAHGWVDDEGTRVRLEGGVELARRESPGVTPLELQTEVLTLYPERDQARTPAHVTLVQPGARLQGVGMRVDLARGYYELNSRVRGRYDVPDSN